MNKSLVIVHGVGDPLPGNALAKLLEGMTAHGWTISEPLRIEHRQEHVASGANPPKFPVAQATVQSASEQCTLTIREVYWGDLSRPKASLFGLVSALFDFIFGLRYIVTAAANELNGLGHLGAQSARAALWLARGPMLALNIIAALICLTYVALDAVDASSTHAPRVAVLLGSAIACVAGILVRYRASRLHWSPATGDATVVLSLLAAAAGLYLWPKLQKDLDPFIGSAAKTSEGMGITDAMSISAALMVLMALVSLLLSAVAALRAAEQRRPLAVVAFCTSLSLGLFTFAVVALWILIGRTIREDKADLIQLCATEVGKPLRHCLKLPADQTVGTLLANRIESGIHLLPWIIFGFAGMAIAFLLVILVNASKGRSTCQPRFRYIINPLVLVTGVVSTALYGILFIILAWSFFQGDPNLPSWMKLDVLKPIALTLTVLVAGLTITSRSEFLTALDLLLDVVAHFRTEEEGFFGDKGRHVVWDQILSRFHVVIEGALKAQPDGLVVAGHSQGTAIAAHALGALLVRAPAANPTLPGSKDVRLLTMGSPIGHLYRHYFPCRYKLSLAAVASWKNIFRIDDFIGTTIDGIEDDGGLNVGTGGHSDYWSDSRVVPLIVDAVRASALPAATAQKLRY